MKIYKKAVIKLALLALFSVSLQTISIPNSLAMPIGKLGFKERTYSKNDSPLISYVGIVKKSISGRVGIGSSIIPSFQVALNSGAPQDFYLAGYSARIAFKVIDPSGTELTYKKNYQDISGSGVLQRDLNSKVFQSTLNYGSAFTFYPPVAGTYKIVVWHDANEDNILDDAEASGYEYLQFEDTKTLSLSITNYGKAIGSMTTDSLGLLTKVCILNNAKSANIQPNYDYENQPDPKMIEQVIVKSNSATEVIDLVSKWNGQTFSMSDNVDSATYTLSSENFNNVGCAYINHYNTAPNPGNVSMNFYGLGPNFPDLNATVTSSYINATLYPLISGSNREVVNSTNLAGSYSSSSSVTASATTKIANELEVGIAPNVGTTVTISAKTEPGVAGVSGASIAMRVIDTDGKITGLKNASYMYVAGSAIDAKDLTVSGSFYASLGETDSYKVYVQGSDSLLAGNLTGSAAIIVKTQKRLPKILEGKVSKVRQIPGSKATYYLKLKDQFGDLLPNTEIYLVTKGRSSESMKFNTYKSNAYGYLEYVSDDSAPVTSELIDTVTGLGPNGVSLLGAGLTIDYSEFTKPEKITVSGAATNEISQNQILNYIDTSYSGASNTLVKMTAVLTDAYGAPVKDGIPVNWRLIGLDNKAFIYSEKLLGEDWTTSYTDEKGQAFTYVYSLGIGDVEVVASFGDGKESNKGLIHFVNQASDVRVISASSGQGFIKAHAEDRYGNPIKNLDLYVQRNSGTGKIPNQGSLRVKMQTNTQGDIYFIVEGGKANFTISTETEKFGQTGSEIGYVNEYSISSSGVGSSYAAKGVGEVTLDVDSRDYIAEAVNTLNNVKTTVDKANETIIAATEKADSALSNVQLTLSKVKGITDSTQSDIDSIRKQLLQLIQILTKISRKFK